jgi:hypothetical protein
VPAFEEAHEEQPSPRGDAAPAEVAGAADDEEAALEGEALASAA